MLQINLLPVILVIFCIFNITLCSNSTEFSNQKNRSSSTILLNPNCDRSSSSGIIKSTIILPLPLQSDEIEIQSDEQDKGFRSSGFRSGGISHHRSGSSHSSGSGRSGSSSNSNSNGRGNSGSGHRGIYGGAAGGGIIYYYIWSHDRNGHSSVVSTETSYVSENVTSTSVISTNGGEQAIAFRGLRAYSSNRSAKSNFMKVVPYLGLFFTTLMIFSM